MKIVRKPGLNEICDIKKLLDSAAAQGGSVLRRPLMELYEGVRDFYIYVDESGLGGCCALHVDTAEFAEVRSLVVRQDLRGQGIGARLLQACLDEGRSLNIKRVYALTRTTSYFGKFGFVEIDKKELPHKVFDDCQKCPLYPDCDEVAVIRDLCGKETPRMENGGSCTNMELQGILGFMGYGNMGGAIARGLIAAKTIPAGRVRVYDVDAAKAGAAASLGIQVCTTPAQLLKGCDTLVLAVKPQMMAEVLEQMKAELSPNTLVISIAAGISTTYVQDRLGPDARVIRVMPNTPALVSAGAAGIAPGKKATESDMLTGRTIFESVGISEVVGEDFIDSVTGLSGSGPAYFFYMVECLIKSAVKHGLSECQAARLAGQTLFGSGKLLVESGEPASVLRERVTSKGGTTAAALAAFESGGLADLISTGVDAAVARAKELGK